MSLKLFKEALEAAAEYHLQDSIEDKKRDEWEKAKIVCEKSKEDVTKKTKKLFIALNICADDIIMCEGIAYKVHKLDVIYRFLAKAPNTIHIDKLPDNAV